MAAEPIRADLGRPETPAERAARKAENSRRYRESKTPNNLVVALLASLAVVLFLVLVVVRPDQPTTGPVDYVAIAADAQPGVSATLARPVLPPGWSANRADLTPAVDESFTWYVGFVTPKKQFVALEQGIDTTPGWLPTLLDSATATGEVTVDGIVWEVFDQRRSEDPGNFAYSLATTSGNTVYLLHGTAADAEFITLASALAPDVQEALSTAETTEPETEG